MISPKQKITAQEGSTNIQSGNDTNIITHIHRDKLGLMKNLIAQYHAEKKAGASSQFLGYIKKLEHYSTVIDPIISDLPTKLIDGGFQNDIDWALQFKESYYKILSENRFSLASQHIHAYLLAKVIVLFNQFIVDGIRSHLPKKEIKELLVEKVIEPIEELIGGEENVLGLYADDINGMIYYLTGNCHLKWI